LLSRIRAYRAEGNPNILQPPGTESKKTGKHVSTIEANFEEHGVELKHDARKWGCPSKRKAARPLQPMQLSVSGSASSLQSRVESATPLKLFNVLTDRGWQTQSTNSYIFFKFCRQYRVSDVFFP
jgi:hypothetical protein